ncbi:MAG: DNA polymerase III subunit alpha [Verrucomicrobia bacterium]|nr:DNA polymerase III subunit alpha [Verrucomicrobiota bacterium]
MNDFTQLHLHSQYSILDAALSIPSAVKRAKELSLTSLALTDFCNMYGAVDFYAECSKEGIKPLLGCEIMVAPESRHEKKKVYGQPSGYPLLLLAKDRTGYQNLCKLTSLAFIEGFYYYPRIDKELLSHHRDGLICLTGPFYGKIGSLVTAGDEAGLQKELEELLSLFGEDLFLEVMRHPINTEACQADGVYEESFLVQKMKDAAEKEELIFQRLKLLSQERGIPCVATNDVRYLDRADWRAHEVLLNVASGESMEIWERDSEGRPRNKVKNPKREVSYSHELYFKTPSEMAELFQDFPEALSNTSLVRDKCHFTFDFSKRFYPVFTPPYLEGKEITREERLKEAENYLKDLCEKGVEARYTEERLERVREKYPGQDPLEVVKARLAYELKIIFSKEMCDYLLIVHDFIAWAKGQKIPVGPGRGSGAGSIILYLIGVTDIEPLRFHLFFERFINPERMSYPDIDVDICMERREEVIAYTMQKYGKDRVAQIITFGTMKARMAIKDVGRVLGVPLAKVNHIASLIPEDLSITIPKAIEIDPELRKLMQEDEEAGKILEMAKKLEGAIRNTGVHAAGLIISGDPLTDHIPICVAKDSNYFVTQYAMKPVEKVGMLKIDFLGLKTLTSIQKTVDTIRDHRGIEIDWINLPLDDATTFNLLNQGKTSGIFQLESGGMQDLAKQLHIDKFEEIIAVGALYRPGPMEMIPSFIQRKHGLEKIEYDHESLKDILAETYGIMVYQEQVMQMASKLAGYSLGEGDVLRWAIGKKNREEMVKQRKKFTEGAQKQGIEEEVATAIFDKVEKFASYGFNKSHAAAYGYLSYVTAFLKANYPYEWMAALMSCDMDDVTKVAKHIREAITLSISVLPPDLNESRDHFVPTAKGIRFALTGIKGVGRGVVEAIIEERKARGAFISLHQFLDRIDLTSVGKKTVEQLIAAGSFDFTGWDRGELLTYLETEFEGLCKKKKEKALGILDLFGGKESSLGTRPTEAKKIEFLEILRREKELLGFFVTGHPLDSYKETLEKLETTSLDSLEALADKALVKVAFVLDTIQVKIASKTQKKFAILSISDGLERFELPIWSDLFEAKAKILIENALILAVLQVEKKENAMRLSCKECVDLVQLDDSGLLAFQKMYTQRVNSEQKRSVQQEKKMSSEEKKQDKVIRVQLSMEKVTMKAILEIKKLLADHPGVEKSVLTFQHEEKTVGLITIDGVKAEAILREKLIKLPYAMACEIVDA